MNKIATLLLTLLTLNVCGQTESKIGTKAPDLQLSTILNFRNTSSKLSDFKSKVVILDFWATWCSPCIESFPHLENLQNKFSSEVQVITITDDPQERIIKFLEKRKVSLPILIDTKMESSIHFPHKSIPHTVIIDRDGIIRAITTPSKIDEEILRRVISNEPISIPEKIDVMNFDPTKPLSGKENFTYQITVTPFMEGLGSFSNSTGGKGGYANRRILAINLSAKNLFEIAYQSSYLQTIVEIDNKHSFEWKKPICFDLIVPEEIGEQRFKIMQQQLNVLYNYQARIEKRIVPVKVLRIIAGEKAKLKISQSGEKTNAYSGKGLSMRNSGPEVIANFLAIQLNKPVIDKTGLSGLYDLDLEWYNEDPNQIYTALKELGLELYDDELPIDVLVISDK